MKFYLLKKSTYSPRPTYLGKAENMQEAKVKFSNKVYGGDFMVSCDDGIDPLYIDKHEIVQMNMDEIKEQIQLFYNNGSMENVPKSAKCFWWEDDEELLLDENGKEWNGNYCLTPELLAEMSQDPEMEQNLYNTIVELDTRWHYNALRPLKPEEYIAMCTEDCDTFDAFKYGLELCEEEFMQAKYIEPGYTYPRCYQTLGEYIKEELGEWYFCEVFNERYALNEGKIVRK